MANELPQSFSFSLPDEESAPLPESFSFSLPEEGGAGAPKPKAEHEGILTGGPEDNLGRSLAKGLATGVARGVAAIPGQIGDIVGLADYARTGVKSLIEDRPWAQIQQEEEAARKKKGNLEFATTDELYNKYFAPYLGEYKPTSAVGRTAMSALEGVVSSGPFGIVRGLMKSAVAPTQATKAAIRNAEIAKVAAASGLGSGAATATTELTGNPLAGIAAGIVAPTVLGASSYRSDPGRNARNTLERYMSTPEETKAKLLAYEKQPGDITQSTAHLTGDEGLARAQHDLQNSTRSTAAFAQDFAALTRQRNEEIANLLQRAASPDADPMHIVNALKMERDNIRGQLDMARNAIPANIDPGEAARLVQTNALAAEREAAKRTSAMYRSLDEGGTGVTPLDNIKKGVAKIQSEYDFGKHGPMDPTIATIVGKYNPETKTWEGGMAQHWGDDMRYLDAVELDQTLEGLRQQLAAQPGKKYERGQVANLKELIKDDFDATTGLSSGQNARLGLAAAKAQHKLVKEIFDNEYVRGALKTGKQGELLMNGVLASQKFFRPGPEGKYAAEAWLRMFGPNKDAALDQLENIATAALGTKTLTPQIIENWKNRYKPALDVLESERPGFMAKFNDLDQASGALSNLQGTIAAKLLDVSDPSQVSPMVGEMLRNRRAGPGQWAEMVAPIQDPAAKMQAVEALKRSGVDFMTNAFYQRDIQAISGASLKKFLNENRANLRGLYGDQYANMERVAEELSKSQQATRVGLAPIGSPTGYNMRAEVQRKPAQDPTLTTLAMTSLGGNYLLPGFGAATGPALYLSQKWLNKTIEQRRVILDRIVADALLDPSVAKALIEKPTMGSLKVLEPYIGETATKVGNAILKRVPVEGLDIAAPYAMGIAGAERGSVGSDIGEKSWKEYNPYLIGKTPTVGEKLLSKAGQLNPFKRGGAVRTLDHGAKADALIRMADKAKKQHNSTTEPLLNQPDEVITKALALADEAI